MHIYLFGTSVRQFEPDTSAVAVTISRRQLAKEFVPPHGTPINASYNPMRVRQRRQTNCCIAARGRPSA